MQFPLMFIWLYMSNISDQIHFLKIHSNYVLLELIFKLNLYSSVYTIYIEVSLVYTHPIFQVVFFF